MIIFAHGADTFRSRRFLQELKNKFTDRVDPGATSLSVVDGQTADLKEISDQANTGSLFVKKRLIVIENIFKNKKETLFTALPDYLKKFSVDEDRIIIFRDEELNTRDKPLKTAGKKLFVFLSQQPYSQEFKPLTGNQLLSFLKKETAQYKKDISAPAALRLIELADGDLWTIAGELKKLAFRVTAPTIERADVDEMVAGSFNENIFALTDAWSVKNKKLAAGLLEEQYAAGLGDEYLLTMLIRQFKILLQIRSALDTKMNPGEMPLALKLHPFVVKKGIGQAGNFSQAVLKDYLNRLIRLDFLNKTGGGNIKTELILLISGL
ncbi:TPA: DNA polymerase III subunit delta [Candidatus Falkowbacteria bacterium]|nr:MAG: polymerase III, delta subunit protein [Candidatus Falkowbacteria bacterium GW2011_GWF2_43_32]HBA36808.1 DNA polymerase III subunit delta [Candidatus Falkowbacteria bacterium]